VSWWGDYIGQPFVEGADRFVCWTLVRVVYADQLGIDLPEYAEIDYADYRGAARKIDGACNHGPWREVSEPRPFDVVVMKRRRIVGHVGVMICAAEFIHVWKGAHTHIARLRDPHIAPLVLSFQRHEAAPC